MSGPPPGPRTTAPSTKRPPASGVRTVRTPACATRQPPSPPPRPRSVTSGSTTRAAIRSTPPLPTQTMPTSAGTSGGQITRTAVTKPGQGRCPRRAWSGSRRPLAPWCSTPPGAVASALMTCWSPAQGSGSPATTPSAPTTALTSAATRASASCPTASQLPRGRPGRPRAASCLTASRPDGPAAGGGLQLADLGYGQHGRPRLVGSPQVDLGADAPVVIAGRVVEDLAYRPAVRLGIDDEHRGPAGVGAGADLVMLGKVRLQRPGPGLGVPAGLGVQRAELGVAAQRGKLDPAEQGVAHQYPERARVVRDGWRPVVDGGRDLRGRISQPFPFIDQAGVDLPDQLAEPLDQVGQVLGPGILRHGLPQRLVGIRQVAQYQPF